MHLFLKLFILVKHSTLGNLGWAHRLGIRDMAEGGSGDGVFLSVGLCQGNLEGGLPLWEP
jgi:hypothetical protein